MPHASEAFEEHAGVYDGERRRLIPPHDAFYAAAVDALGLAGCRLRRVLDLGAGTGILARAVAAALPEADLTLLDRSPAMLEVARSLLGDGVGYVVTDLTDPLPCGPWDAVVSALAIHHLDDADKRRLFARLHTAISPGGVFVNAEQVAGPTPRFAELYASWHERRAIEAGASPQEWGGALERMRFDRWATVESQLGWLRDAGFTETDCLFKDHRFAVLVARNPD